MSEYEFGGMLYRNNREMHIAIAESWLSGYGRNTTRFIADIISSVSDSDLADEVIAGWKECDRDELIAAFADIRQHFDRHFPDKDRA
jgi:hypothetical protein